jgi:hypothetical protein
MTDHQSGANVSVRPRKRIAFVLPPRARRIVLLCAAVVGLVAAVYFYDYLSVNLWLDRDAGRLGNYPVHLIEDQQEVARPPDKRSEQIDRLLIEEMHRVPRNVSTPRNVVTVSRSEIKYSLFRTRAYVKVFLETAPPGQAGRRSRMRVICELKRGPQGWQLVEPPVEKTIE